MMSPHLPYVLGAYGFSACIFLYLIYWVVKQDRKASQQLSLWQSNDT